jgi:ceramide glucosyltransferase
MAGALLFAALVGLVSSTVYLTMAVIAARRFVARRRHVSPHTTDSRLPHVSVLKPVHGVEARLEESVDTFFTQNHPAFELIFGARARTDGALQFVERLRAKYPDVNARIVIAGDPVYPNAKVAALEQMVDAASSSFLVIADSDVRVGPDYLAQVVAPLLDPRTGLVTCLYRGVPTGGWWSALEALGMSVEMTSGVLVADLLEGMRFALGPTMAVRKDVLEAIGGMRVLQAHLSDDYVLGQRVHAAGYRVVLSHYVIDHFAVNRSVRQSWQHHLRWMRGTRFSRPAGHLGTVFTFAMPFGILGFIAALANGQSQLAIACLAWACVNRLLQCLAIGWGVVRDPSALARCWIYPARDLIGFAVWCSSWFGSAVVWRGEQYDLRSDGTMHRVGTDDSRRAIDGSPRREAV